MLGLLLGAFFILRKILFFSYDQDDEFFGLARQLDHYGLAAISGAHKGLGYPLWLSLFFPLGRLLHADPSMLIPPVQMAGYFAAAFALRQAIASHSIRAARLVWMGCCCNIFALSYLALIITDSFALIFLLLLAVWWTRSSCPSPRPSSARGRGGSALTATSFTGAALTGCLVIIRPGNLLLLPVFAAGLAALLWMKPQYRKLPLVSCALLGGLIGFALPLSPQIAMNRTYYNSLSPVPHEPLLYSQLFRGRYQLKVGGALVAQRLIPVFYLNPLFEDAEKQPRTWRVLPENRPADPLRWYVDHPLAGLATMALHDFNLVDQDMFFGHSPELHPWWRLPSILLDHCMLALAALGLIAWRKQANTAPGLCAWALLTLFILAHFALYSLMAVEMRYGLPLLLAASPLAFVGAASLFQYPFRRKLAIMLLVAAYVGFAMTLSNWVRDQSPQLRTHTNAG